MNASRIRPPQLLALFLLMLFLPLSVLQGQGGRPARSGGSTVIKWDDYTFKFLPGNQMGQVLDTGGHVIGTILSMGGELKVLPTVTGSDAEKLKKSFENWKAQGGEKSLNSATPEPGSHTRPSAPSARTEKSPAQSDTAPQPANSRQASTPAPAASPARTASGFKYGILDEAGLNKLGKGVTFRFDLTLLRLMPQLLDEKLFMRYFIALNNCDDKNVAKTLNNELDYPELAELYKPRAQEILNSLPKTVGMVLYGEPGLWKKTPMLGEYAKSKGSFPITVPDHPNGAEVPGILNFDLGRSEFRAPCSIANQVLSSRTFGSMPSSYSISVKPMYFKELHMDEAAARKYIDSPGGSQRGFVLLVEMRMLDVPPVLKKSGATITSATFSAEVARVRAAKLSGDTIGTLFDDGTLPPP